MTKSFAVITSGGDAPGMNSALRSIVRSGIAAGYTVYGYYRGYQGIFAGEYEQMTSFSVSGLLSRGGSALGCARSAEMLEPDGPAKAAAKLKEHGLILAVREGHAPPPTRSPLRRPHSQCRLLHVGQRPR